MVDAEAAQPKPPRASAARELSAAQPAWMALDKKVLNFSAFYTEDIHQGTEDTRTRHVKILFYLEDDTVQISARAGDHCGLPQGTLLKRTRVPLPSRSGRTRDYEVHDFNVGINLTFFGRSYTLYDCDLFTRDALTKLGIQVNPATSAPADPFESQRTARLQLEQTGVPRAADARHYPLKQFLDNDGKVLRFAGVWDDSARPHGFVHHLTLAFYLADDSIEIHEKSPGGVLTFLKRQLLPRDQHAIVQQPGTHVGRPAHFTELDFCVGNTVPVFGRAVLVVAADEFTKCYFHEHHGRELMDLPRPEERRVVVPRTVPPPNGFGSDEDSLASLHSIVPKVPRKKIGRFLPRNTDLPEARLVLRYAAQLTHPSDATELRRSFVIAYFLTDDTVAIFEKAEANTGFVTGKFLERGPQKWPSGDPVIATDLYVGAQINIRCFEFTIVAADEFALTFMEDNHFPCADAAAILARLTSADLGLVRTMFVDITREGGATDQDKFDDTLHRTFPGLLNEHEAITLVRRFSEPSTTGGVEVRVPDFLRALGLEEQ